MEEEEKPAYYSIITADVRYDKRITPNAKLLFSEITALCNKNGYCWAKNSYFSKLYGVTTQAISKWINSLADNGYLDLEYEYEGKEIIRRNIYIKTSPKNRLGVSTPSLGVSTKEGEGINKRLIRYQQKIKDNTTSINTIKDNINIEYLFLEKEVVEQNNETTELFTDIPLKQPKEKKQDEKKTKNKHGIHFRVMLDGYEYDAMIKEIGEDKTKKLIERADNWLFNNSIKNVKNHYSMMMKWYGKEKEEEENKRIKDIPVSYTGYEAMLEERKKQEEEARDVVLDFSSLKERINKNKGVNK